MTPLGRKRTSYRREQHNRHSIRKTTVILIAVLSIAGIGYYAKQQFMSSAKSPEYAASALRFDDSVGDQEQQKIKSAITYQQITYSGSITAHATTSLEPKTNATIINAYVPVTNNYSLRNNITTDELKQLNLQQLSETSGAVRQSIDATLGLTSITRTPSLDVIKDQEIVLIPVDKLSPAVKLLSLNGDYYLDNPSKGALFRSITFSGPNGGVLQDLKLYDHSNDTILTFRQTGVTALTRLMMRKLSQVNDPTYFSKDIGPFLASADITHVSNEVSFKQGCSYNNAVFCSPPAFIETLKASGVDIVELTGNHNNDTGRQYNTESINLYHQLGWGTVGGGLNAAEAAKAYNIDKKNTKIALLAYNYPDSPNGLAIATSDDAGANGFDPSRIKQEIAAARAQGAQSIIVDIQFWECYSYPDGYVEFPVCDEPITDQKAVFRSMIDYGADMVVGTSAHQPQTFEFYQGKPIYYGLGNLYFEQTQWPGTERGIILTHYYKSGSLLQTKMTPTVYDSAYQTRIMNQDESNYLMQRLQSARNRAGL